MAKLREKVIAQVHLADLYSMYGSALPMTGSNAQNYLTALENVNLKSQHDQYRLGLLADKGAHLLANKLIHKDHKSKPSVIELNQNRLGDDKVIPDREEKEAVIKIESSRQSHGQVLPQGRKPFKSYIYIIQIKSNKIYETIQLPFIPKVLDWDIKTDLNAIMSLGRNNPSDFHFTGAEDTLEFEIDWFFTTGSSDDSEYRKSAMNNALKLVSWAKADGYTSSPLPINLIWGPETFLIPQKGITMYTSDYKSNIFINDLWVIKSIKGKLEEFYKPMSLLPQRVTQTITLEKMAPTNPTTKQLLSW